MWNHSILLLLLSCVTNINAFSIPSAHHRTRTPTLRRFSSETTVDREAIFEEIGIKEESLALGVRPQEVLQYIGSREDLVVKTMNDIPAFDRSKAEEEVDKFLLDAEMINIYIQYGKEIERDPSFKVPDAPNDDGGLFSFRNLAVLYVLFIASQNVPDFFRDYVAEQQLAGTWTETGVGFLDEWIDKTTPEATAKALAKAAAAAAKAVSSESAAVEAVSSAIQDAVDASN